MLERVEEERVRARTDPPVITSAEQVIGLIDTSPDKKRTSGQAANSSALAGYAEDPRRGHTLVRCRSTLLLTVTALAEKLMGGLGLQVDVAFCPEWFTWS